MQSAIDVYLHPLVPPDRGAEWAPLQHWQADRPFNRDAPTSNEKVKVYANHGRWIAECPDCKGAQIACKSDPRFMCHCCGNASVGGKYRGLIWPAKVQAIEELLDVRPELHRNWVPGESLADLSAENKEMMNEAGEVVG